MKRLMLGVATLLMVLGAGPAVAWHLQGYVYCEGNGLPLAGVTIQVSSTDGAGFTGSATSDASGFYSIALPEVPHCYEATAIVGPGESVVSPAGGTFAFCTTVSTFEITQDWLVASPSCLSLGCWLTGGGQSERTSPGEKFSWGGNVNPGCSPTAGEGGQWNTLDFTTNLHFQGFAIEVLRCGNVDGIPPGSTSPETPFNFIEFQGTGRVQGIQGNDADYPLVYFFGRAEDRAEPGSHGQPDADAKDRLFLNVYTDAGDPTGSSILLLDGDGDPATTDPLAILHGNLQIHVSSCTIDPTTTGRGTATKMGVSGQATAGTLPATVSFAAPGPNPAVNRAVLRYALPRDADLSLAVYDVTGRMVKRLATGPSTAGQYAVTWNLVNESGHVVPNGVYFARLAVGGQTFTRPVSVAR